MIFDDFFNPYYNTGTKNHIINNNIMEILVFFTGAAGYSLIEYLFRGYTHWTMTLTGGACLLTFYCYLKVRRDASMLAKAAAGALIITVFEFFVGIVVNMWYGWDVWDYSGKMLNILGQVCPEYSLAWFLICFTVLAVSEGMNSTFHALQRGIHVRFNKNTKLYK